MPLRRIIDISSETGMARSLTAGSLDPSTEGGQRNKRDYMRDFISTRGSQGWFASGDEKRFTEKKNERVHLGTSRAHGGNDSLRKGQTRGPQWGRWGGPESKAKKRPAEGKVGWALVREIEDILLIQGSRGPDRRVDQGRKETWEDSGGGPALKEVAYYSVRKKTSSGRGGHL